MSSDQGGDAVNAMPRCFSAGCVSVFMHGSGRVHDAAQGITGNNDAQQHENDADRVVDNETAYEPQGDAHEDRQHEIASFCIHTSPYKLSVVSDRT